MCGARGAPRPWIIASGTRARIAASSRSRSALEAARTPPRARRPRARRRARGRPPSRRSPCPGDGRGPASRRTAAAPSACRGGCTARRCPSARRSCVPRSRAGRMASLRASISTLPNACTASVWKTTPRAFARARRARQRPGSCRSRCSPTSPSRPRRRRARARRTTRRRRRPSTSTASSRSSPPPARSGARRRARPCARSASYTAALRRPSPRRARQTPRIAMLSASVPHEVKHDLVRRTRRDIGRRARAPRRAPCALRGPTGACWTGCRSAARRRAASPRGPPRARAWWRRGRGRLGSGIRSKVNGEGAAARGRRQRAAQHRAHGRGVEPDEPLRRARSARTAPRAPREGRGSRARTRRRRKAHGGPRACLLSRSSTDGRIHAEQLSPRAASARRGLRREHRPLRGERPSAIVRPVRSSSRSTPASRASSAASGERPTRRTR